MNNSLQRISIMDWASPFILTTGSRDKSIKIFDLRTG